MIFFFFYLLGFDRCKIEIMLIVIVMFNKYNYVNLMLKRVLINFNVFFLRNNINSFDY